MKLTIVTCNIFYLKVIIFWRYYWSKIKIFDFKKSKGYQDAFSNSISMQFNTLIDCLLPGSHHCNVCVQLFCWMPPPP